MCRLSRNPGALTSQTPQSHVILFRGYFTFTFTLPCEQIRSLAFTPYLQHSNSGYQLFYLRRFFPSILGTFAKLRKATISYVISVRPSAWSNSAPTGRIFMTFDVSLFFVNLSKTQVLLKSDKNNAYFTWRPVHIFFIIPHFIRLRMETFSDKCCRETWNISFMLKIIFFPENRAVYEIMRKNTVERDRPQMTIWRMRIACWIPKATNTNTNTDYIILIALPLQEWLHERALILHCQYIACLVIILRYSRIS
jgi:hypothetical protein